MRPWSGARTDHGYRLGPDRKHLPLLIAHRRADVDGPLSRMPPRSLRHPGFIDSLI